MNKNNFETYYLYIDDSGKFKNEMDNHVIYSYLLLSKVQRKELFVNYLCVTSAIFPNKFERFSGMAFEKDFRINFSIPWEPIKGNDLIKKYARNTRNMQNPISNSNILDLNNLFALFKIPKEVGSVIWCKQKVEKEFGTIKTKYILNKYILILKIVDSLLNSKKISSNSKIKIYLDVETDDNLAIDFKELQLKRFLNQKLNEVITIRQDEEDFYHYQRPEINSYNYKKMISNLRNNLISIGEVKFLDSQYSFPIQMADITANLTNKLINKNLSINSTIPYFNEGKISLVGNIFLEDFSLNLQNDQKCCK